MREFHYELIDVFTKEPFGGNQLAVFKDAAGLSANEMQKITRELNLSEATFVTELTKEQATVHIFTPRREVPIAGHPTIGTGYVFARDGEIETYEGGNSFLFEEQIGEIPLKLIKQQQKITAVEMVQPIPEFRDIFRSKEVIGSLLSIDSTDISERVPMQVVSAGVPLMGIVEDPATGAASGPLGAYLAHYDLVSSETSGKYTILSEQGMEIERPSQIRINVTYTDDKISFVSIAGSSVDIGRGTIVLPS